MMPIQRFQTRMEPPLAKSSSDRRDEQQTQTSYRLEQRVEGIFDGRRELRHLIRRNQHVMDRVFLPTRQFNLAKDDAADHS